MDGSWWKVLTEHDPLENGIANHFSILALKTPWIVWTVWKGTYLDKNNITQHKKSENTQNNTICIILYIWTCRIGDIFLWWEKKQWLSLEWVGKLENLGSADLGVTYNYLLVKTQWMFIKSSCISMYIYLNSKENKPANKYLILLNYKQD